MHCVLGFGVGCGLVGWLMCGCEMEVGVEVVMDYID